MKKLLLLIAVAIASTTLAYSLSPIVVAVNYNNGENLSVSVTEGSGPEIYTEEIERTEPNSSGLIIFSVGNNNQSWEDILESSVTTSHVVNVMDNGTIVAQYRLDYLIDLSARMGLISSSLKVKGDVTIEGDTYLNSNYGLSVGEFESQAEFSALTTNIMVFTGGGDLTLNVNNINTDLLNNGVYYIVSTAVENFLEFEDDYFPDINNNEFIMFLKVDDEIILLNHERNNEFPFEN